MSFSTAGVQTGTDTSLAGMTSITGTTTSVVNGKTRYLVTTQVTISGTLSWDATTEFFVCSGTQSEQLRITGTGAINARGGLASSSFGNGARLDTLPTAFRLAKTGTQCCASGSIAVESGGRMNLSGVRIEVDSVMAWESGSGGIIKNSIFFNQTVPASNTTRIRVAGATNWDIQGLDLYNMQFDWLTDEAFIASTGMRGLNAGLPIEHATGTDGATRAWREVRDPRGAAAAFGNNWNGLKNVRLTLCEAGTGTMIVPDSVNGTLSGTGHGALLFHEYTMSVVGSAAVSGKCFVRDIDNGNRRTITTPNTIEDTDVDQFLITTITASAGALTTILIGHWYRNNSVGDLAAPDGNEVLDARGKNDVTAVVADDDDRDLFDVHFKGLDWSYGGSPDFQMNGLSASNVFIGVLLDTGRDADSSATIAAYTFLPTSTKAYNAMKYWSVLDANLEVPSSSTFLMSASGETIIATGAYDIDLINGTNANPFQFSAPTISLYIGTGFVGGLETTGDISIGNNVDADGSTFTGTTYLNWAADLTDVTVNGDLHVNIAANTTLTFTNVTVTGDVYNDATGNTLTINATGGSSLTAGDPGTGNGQSNIITTVPIKVTVKDAATLALIQGARVRIVTEAGGPASAGVELINELTDVSGEVNDLVQYDGDQPVSGVVRKGTP